MGTGAAELFAVRRARPADCESIARVHVASWEAAYEGIIRPETIAKFDYASRVALWRRALRGAGSVWVAAEDGLVIGFVEVRGDEVTVLYLHPGWWRLGLGGSLLRRSLHEIAASGYREAHLWVLAGNANARAFYARQGGTAGDSRPVQVGRDKLVELRYAWRLPALTR